MADADEIFEALREAIELRRGSLEADPTLSGLTLVVRINDAGHPARVLYRTESKDPQDLKGARTP